MRTLSFFILAIGLLAIGLPLNGQIYLLNGNPINTCGGSFYDSGGPTTDYLVNEDLSTTICSSSGGVNSHLRLQFTDVDLGEDAQLSFFDGLNDQAPSILPSTTFDSGLPFAIQSTAANSSGCIFVRFSSGADATARGWRADISCTPACQTILSSAQSTPATNFDAPIFIDLCPGDSVQLRALPLFPQNGLNYTQSPDNCTYNWFASDGQAVAARDAQFVFPEAGGYRLRLDITDSFGCRNVDYLDLIVRASPSPAMILNQVLDSTYCWGDTIILRTLINTISDIPGLQVLPVPLVELSSVIVGDSLFLPDGNGDRYEQNLFVNGYPDSLTFGDLGEGQRFYFNMEHSYAGDLDMYLSCPDGSQVPLLEQTGGSTNFGEPFADGTVDSGARTNDRTPGIGYDYYIKDDSENGEFRLAPRGDALNTTVPSIIDGVTFTYRDQFFASGEYSPVQPLTSLAGCPMNGEWTITVVDNLLRDNGWIFGWGFEGSNSQILEHLDTVYVENWGWEYSPDILLESLDSIVVLPTDFGLRSLQFWLEDNYGCASDTTFSFSILPPDAPRCLTTDTEEALAGYWQLFPNPTQDQLVIDPDSENVADWQYSVHAINGQVLRTGVHRGRLRLSTAAWPSGLYLIKVQQDGHQSTWRILKP